MKLRIKDASVRLRLDKVDLDTLNEKGKVETVTPFWNRMLKYAVRTTTSVSHLSATFENERIMLYIPESYLAEMIETDKVGFDHVQKNEDGTQLSILIEKDFKCLTPRNEDESNAFPNPQEGHSC
ncbi:hypothetical protein V6R21_16975 [Limibacter armeniacum]|uniref:DUF7009 family protein n=1 Tax=Limibacter armeniacum TaxID=466084 RepID=UPI002FE598D1